MDTPTELHRLGAAARRSYDALAEIHGALAEIQGKIYDALSSYRVVFLSCSPGAEGTAIPLYELDRWDLVRLAEVGPGVPIPWHNRRDSEEGTLTLELSPAATASGS